ncbi:MAG: DUF2461 domain-containing protein [Acidobacteriota bacterium]|nr:DUF2461 domain-containing protein [Acidobacteriota bacterium]
MAHTPFTQEFFRFYDQLEANNDRSWFQENKELYEDAVRTPMLSFIEAMGPKLADISKHIVADPRKSGGSMFRIYRDTRFSKDKTPYKTHAACQFRHVMGKDVHAPGFYMHASQREVVFGAGIWHPDAPSLAKIRQYIAENPEKWQQALDHAPFAELFEQAGESLKRLPRGFPADHPMVEELKRKDFIAMRGLMPPDLLREDLIEEVSRCFAACRPYMKCLCDALQLPF